MSSDSHLDAYRGRVVVLDLSSPYVVLGTLESWDDAYLCLAEADVHDLRTSQSTREFYVVDAKDSGIQVNRERVLIARPEVVGVSALDDVRR
jgi:hypothetical protein